MRTPEKKPARTVLLALAAMTALGAPPAAALEIQNSGYDYWHQYYGQMRTGVVRLNLFDADPMRNEDDPEMPFYETMVMQQPDAIATAVVLADDNPDGPQFLMTTATPVLGTGVFSTVINGEFYFGIDSYVPGPADRFEFFNEDIDNDNLMIIRLDRPIPAGTVQAYSMPAPTDDFRGTEVEIVSFGDLTAPDIGTISGGIRRSGFNKLDVVEINENLRGEGLVGMDMDRWPPSAVLFNPLISGIDPPEMEEIVPLHLEAVPDATDGGTPALAGDTLAGILSGGFTRQFGNEEPDTFINFVDLAPWADDIAFLLDRDNWVEDPLLPPDGIPDFPTTPQPDFDPAPDPSTCGNAVSMIPCDFYIFGWNRYLPGYDVEFVKGEGPDMILIEDTDLVPQALVEMMGPAADPPPAGGGGGSASAAQAIAEATIEFFNFLETNEVFGAGAQFALLQNGLGVFANSFDQDYIQAGGPGPIDFTGVNLAPATIGLLIDFNQDGTLSGLDIDALYGSVGLVVGPGTELLDGVKDLDLDGSVTQLDVDMLVQDVLGLDYGDLNFDGLVNHLDKATLEGNLDSPGGWESGDVDGSGVVDATDLAVLLSNLSLLLGDANNDGVVTANDLLAIQQNFGASGDPDGLLLGDANDDGVVTADDLLSAQQNFGTVFVGGGGANGGVSSVPEPGTGVLMLAAAAVLRRRRRG